MKKRNGFTLVEIIVVIALLSVIAGIFILNMTGALNRSKQNEDNETRNTVISAAKAYVTSNPEKVENLYRGFSYVDIKIGELRDEGYLQEDLKSASTGEIIPDGKIVRVTYNQETDDVDYDFIEEGEVVELTRYDLVAEPISLKHNQKAVGNWCEQNYKYGYYADNADSKMYFVDESNKKVPQPEDKITLTLTNNCDVDLTRVGKYKIEYKYTYEDNGETITSTKIRNVYVVPDQFNVVFHENAINNITKQPAPVTNMPGNEDVTWSQEYTFSNKTPRRTGYTFEYWSYESNRKSEVTYQPNQTLIFKPVIDGNLLNLYAIWKPNTYTITLDNQSATTAGTTVIYETYEHKYSLTKEGMSITNITTPTREGYIFEGYYTSKNGLGTQIINSSGKIVADTTYFLSNTTIYAKWKPIVYTITYYLDGGTNNAQNPSTYTIETDTIRLKNPRKDHYVFDGWFTDSSYTNSVNSIPKGSIGNKKFYAKFSLELHTISFSCSYSCPAEKSVAYGNTTSLPSASGSGYYYFNYWTNGGSVYYAGSTVTVYSNMTFSANYYYSPPTTTTRYYDDSDPCAGLTGRRRRQCEGTDDEPSEQCHDEVCTDDGWVLSDADGNESTAAEYGKIGRGKSKTSCDKAGKMGKYCW